MYAITLQYLFVTNKTFPVSLFYQFLLKQMILTKTESTCKNKIKIFRKIRWLLVLGVLINACQSAENSSSYNLKTLPVRYAQRFSIEYNENFQYLMTIRLENDSILYKLPTNVSKIICASTTHVAMLHVLGADSCLIGILGGQYLCNPYQRRRYETKQIRELGSISQPDLESILMLRPDVILLSSRPEELPATWKLIQQTGIPIIFIAEWLENTPLGRCEWLRVIGIMTNKLARADKFLDSVAAIYQHLCLSVQKDSSKNSPTVVAGMGYQGVWYVPAGRSYVATLLKDAGAHYPWENIGGEGSLSLDFETFYAKALHADILINVGTCRSIAELIALDKRLAFLKAVQQKKVYNNDLRITDNGINEYYETSVVAPEKILSDLIHILQQKDSLYYYRKLF
ncbi:MAG: ABC transporter substrate-binding protein [Cytophagales bacterium]|nr:ABC transporter substrate-binding protein [Cytophagales bacterium]MDW8383646.1 ABC transporter substrate-binding protein [Flammeovirgaceae bacterium]